MPTFGALRYYTKADSHFHYRDEANTDDRNDDFVVLVLFFNDEQEALVSINGTGTEWDTKIIRTQVILAGSGRDLTYQHGGSTRSLIILRDEDNSWGSHAELHLADKAGTYKLRHDKAQSDAVDPQQLWQRYEKQQS